MDLKFKNEDGMFQIRVGAIIQDKGRILFHKGTNEPFYALIGGRCEMFEDTANTIRRELKEELGEKNVKVNALKFVVENFFEMNGYNYHELCFIYTAEFEKDSKYNNMDKFDGIEGKTDLYYEWLPICDIEKYDIKPDFLKDKLKYINNSNIIEHFVIKK